jgi:hypothetical protein
MPSSVGIASIITKIVTVMATSFRKHITPTSAFYYVEPSLALT